MTEQEHLAEGVHGTESLAPDDREAAAYTVSLVEKLEEMGNWRGVGLVLAEHRETVHEALPERRQFLVDIQARLEAARAHEATNGAGSLLKLDHPLVRIALKWAADDRTDAQMSKVGRSGS